MAVARGWQTDKKVWDWNLSHSESVQLSPNMWRVCSHLTNTCDLIAGTGSQLTPASCRLQLVRWLKGAVLGISKTKTSNTYPKSRRSNWSHRAKIPGQKYVWFWLRQLICLIIFCILPWLGQMVASVVSVITKLRVPNCVYCNLVGGPWNTWNTRRPLKHMVWRPKSIIAWFLVGAVNLVLQLK